VGGRSLNEVSCSNGDYGLITNYGWTSQGAIPNFPYIGGSADIAGWDSPKVCQPPHLYCWYIRVHGERAELSRIRDVKSRVSVDILNSW
jgi:hypothetical protein